MTDVIVGVDAGTSVIKAVAFSTAGETIAVASRPNVYGTAPGGGCEQDMARTWAEAAATLRDIAGRLSRSHSVAALAITGQGDGTWLMDAVGDPVAPAWLWLDARAAALVERRRAAASERERFQINGTGLSACQQGPQLAVMERDMPGVLDRAATAFHCKDWLYFNLTGRRVTDPSEGVFSFGDFRTRAYSDGVIDLLGLGHRRDLMPEIVDGTRHHDTLTAAAARRIGMPAGTPVVLGNVDVICNALGAGLYEPGRDIGTTVIGSTGMHMAFVADAGAVKLSDACTGYTACFPVPGGYAQMQSNMAGTLNIDWLLDLALGVLTREGVSRDRDGLLAGLDDLVLGVEPGNILYQPHISPAGERGPFLDPNARAGFIGLHNGHGYADLMRAVFDGLAYAARDCYRAMGRQPAEVRLTGGAARSVALRRIIASALNAPVRVSEREEAGAAGAAMIAAVNLGIHDTMDACVAQWVTPSLGEPEPPVPEWTSCYDRLYPAYAEAHRAVAPIWRMLADPPDVQDV